MVVLHFYRREDEKGSGLQRAGQSCPKITILTESCFNVEWSGTSAPSPEEREALLWLFSSPFEPELVREKPFLTPAEGERLVEIGPRLNFSTAWSTNAVSICQSVGLRAVSRIERSRRHLIQPRDGQKEKLLDGEVDRLTSILFDKMTECIYSRPIESFAVETRPQKPRDGQKEKLLDGEVDRLTSILFDKMTECIYSRPIESFAVETRPQKVFQVDILGEGRAALEKANQDLGLAFDSWDLDYYTALFQRVQLNPTSVECFDLAQSNSEHSRHWFFRGRMKVDGVEKEETLFSLIMGTQQHSNKNNVIKFCDNSSGIEGREVESLFPTDPTQASAYQRLPSKRHVIFTAETHNFPTGVAPFSGATTGTGGRIRDVQSTGRGAHVIAGTAGYCFGNLLIPGHNLPWEEPGFEYPPSFARPLQVAIEASNGASDYGNKFGEPVLAGFARSFGMRLPNGERREWIKPIMFSGGVGSIEDQHVTKEGAELGMEVVKIGGPVYRIGVGGGAASSIQVQGDNSSDLDFGAVQRGDAEMEQKMNRALRACIENRAGNPVCSIHDQGAGGNGNVLKELSVLLYVPLSPGRYRLGGSALAQCFCQLGDSTPDLDHPDKLTACFQTTQSLLQDSLLSSGHDVSDGGLISCLLEMAFAGNRGIEVDLPLDGAEVLEVLFSEELGLVLEVRESGVAQVCERYRDAGLSCLTIGRTRGLGPYSMVKVSVRGQEVLCERMTSLRGLWESTSFQLERLQANPVCVQQEEEGLANRTGPNYKLTFDPAVIPSILFQVKVSVRGQEVLCEQMTSLRGLWESTSFQLERLQANPVCVQQEEEGLANRTGPNYKLTFDPAVIPSILKELGEVRPRVAVVREEGSNGDREMAASLLMAGFEVWDVTMQDLCSGTVTLDPFRGVVFVGGFSYADVLGSAKGWAATVTFNPRARTQFAAFRSREDTFSLGVCNGCQLMALLGWVGSESEDRDPKEEESLMQGVLLTHNQSGRFESRFVSVALLPSPALMLRGMEGSTLGVWVAHGEGYMQFRSPALLDQLDSQALAPLRYVDDSGSPTEHYPLNPNGSPRGIAGLCSADGRHLAMMPHPERAVLGWQWPWAPAEMRDALVHSPWLTMFRNAAAWCLSSQ
ncbi:UNVERIFIED_CONTAM: hypothetical protein FKN15_076654 [Acipenser sinensis]